MSATREMLDTQSALITPPLRSTIPDEMNMRRHLRCTGGASLGPAVPHTEGCRLLWIGRRLRCGHVLYGLLHALRIHHDCQELLSKGRYYKSVPYTQLKF